MSVVGKGLGAIAENVKSSFAYLKLKDGESAIIRIAVSADDIISVREHVLQIGGQWHTLTCLGKKDCPICATGDRPNFAAYLPIIHRNDEDKLKIFKAGKRAAGPLVEIAEEYGEFTKRDFKVTRQGTKGNTQYIYFPRDPSEFNFSEVTMPDIEALVQPLSKEVLINLLNNVNNTQDSNQNTGTNEGKDFPF